MREIYDIDALYPRYLDTGEKVSGEQFKDMTSERLEYAGEAIYGPGGTVGWIYHVTYHHYVPE